MNICPFCDRDNRQGVMLCEFCGRAMSSLSVLHTRVVEQVPTGSNAHWHGNAQFNQNTQVILYVRGATQPLVLPTQARLILGRVSDDHDENPDVDMTQFSAFEYGVSAQHVALERADDQLLIIDLDSTNGTFLDHQPLVPHQAAIVYDGAEVRLGNLECRLYFEL